MVGPEPAAAGCKKPGGRGLIASVGPEPLWCPPQPFSRTGVSSGPPPQLRDCSSLSPSSPPGPIPTPQTASSRNPTSSQGRFQLPPISSSKPRPCLAALAGPSGCSGWTLWLPWLDPLAPSLLPDSDRRALAGRAKGPGHGCPAHGAWRQVCAQEISFQWNSDETGQGREPEGQRDEGLRQRETGN